MHGIGYYLHQIELSSSIKTLVLNAQYDQVYDELTKLTFPGEVLFQILRKYKAISQIETMLALRDSANPDEEDGIWHDDGSRQIAFSLSLNLSHASIEGGELGIRRKGASNMERIPTRPFGELIIFRTGVDGFEHKTFRVSRGKRLVFVGWGSV